MGIVAQDKGGIVYELIDLHNGKGYAGKDSNPKLIDGVWIAQRPAVHFAQAMRGGDECPYLNRAIRRNIRLYGKPYFLVIHHPDWHPNQDALNAAEKRLIKARGYYPPKAGKGYNCTKGGGGTVGYVPTQAARDKQSAATRGRKQSPGLVAKRADALRGVPKSAEHVANLIAASPQIKYRDENIDRAVEMYVSGKSSEDVAAAFNVSRRTIKNWIGVYNEMNPHAKIPTNRRACLRSKSIGGVLSMLADGKTKTTIADAFGVDVQTIYNWLDWHNSHLDESG